MIKNGIIGIVSKLEGKNTLVLLSVFFFVYIYKRHASGRGEA